MRGHPGCVKVEGKSINIEERTSIMGLLAYLLLGLIAGAIAKSIFPGKQSGGWLATLVLGVIGAMVGGWLGGVIFKVDVMASFWSLSAWICAIVGSVIVLLIYGALTGRKN